MNHAYQMMLFLQNMKSKLLIKLVLNESSC